MPICKEGFVGANIIHCFCIPMMQCIANWHTALWARDPLLYKCYSGVHQVKGLGFSCLLCGCVVCIWRWTCRCVRGVFVSIRLWRSVIVSWWRRRLIYVGPGTRTGHHITQTNALTPPPPTSPPATLLNNQDSEVIEGQTRQLRILKMFAQFLPILFSRKKNSH